MLRRYVHGGGVDQPLLWYEGDQTDSASQRGLFANHQGSIAAVADSAGNPIAINGYDSYGIPNETNIGRFQYTGQIWLPELGLYYYKARVYSPTLGRFLQTDPIGYEGGYNIYRYALNDPVNYNDPTGEAPDSVIDRRTQALLQTTKDCKGKSAQCGAFFAEAIALPLSLYPGGAFIKVGTTIFRGRQAINISSQIFRKQASKISNTINRDFNRNKKDGLADAIRRELKTGELVGGKSHLQKGNDALGFVKNQKNKIAKDKSLLQKDKNKLIKRLDGFAKKSEMLRKRPENDIRRTRKTDL